MSDGRVIIDTLLDDKGIDKGKAAIEGKLGDMSQTAGKITDNMKNMLVGAMAAVSARAIFEFGKVAVETAATAEALESQFSQVFGDVKNEAIDALSQIADETNILPTRLKPAFTQMAAFAKTTGADTAEALELTKRATMAAADSAAFYDRSIEEVTDSLQSFLKGNFENDAALGISATETTRNAKANELYAMSFNELDEAQKQLTLLAMVEEGNKLSGALGQAAREGEAYENVLGNLKEAWSMFQGELGKHILPIVTEAMVWLTNVLLDAKGAIQTAINWFKTLWDTLTTGTGHFNSFLTGMEDIWYLIIEAFGEGDFSRIGELAGEIVPYILNSILGGLPKLLEMGSNLINKLAEGMGVSVPELMQMAIDLITGWIFGFLDGIPMIMNTGIQLIEGLIAGITEAIPMLLSIYQEAWQMIIDAVIEFLPLFVESAIGIVLALADGIMQTLPQLLDTAILLIESILGMFITMLPQVLEMGITILMTLVDGVMSMLPQLIDMAVQLIVTLVNMIVSNLPMIIDSGIQILNSLVDGILNALPGLIDAAINLVMTIFENIIANLPDIIEAGIQLLLALVSGILKTVFELSSAADEIIATVWDRIKDIDWLDLGRQIINGIAAGISSVGGVIWDSLKGAVSGAWQKTKEFLGIASPSKLMKNSVGRYIPEGLAVGIDDESDQVYEAALNMGKQVMAGVGNIQMPELKQRGSILGDYVLSGSSNTNVTNDNGVTIHIEKIENYSDSDIPRILEEAAWIMGREDKRL
ncbi:phage tail protein [Atopococcus tabaci]|uniref:phage tail protein n=1 Tax=Atopococcus tabaci TaxID=269774 RepID=UPI00240916FB|nr:hypothetical protein [Atopococcus tabaci]